MISELNKQMMSLLWESNLNKYIVPQTFQCLEVIRLYQTSYIPKKRAIITPSKEILFTITAESTNQMLQIQPRPDEMAYLLRPLLSYI